MVLLSPFVQELRRLLSLAGTKSVLHTELESRHLKIPLQAAVEIMERQGGLLSDRPRMIAAGEILSGGQSIGSINGDKFRRMRRFVNGVKMHKQPSLTGTKCRVLHAHLQPKAAEAYQPLQMSHAKHTVLDILDDPHNFHTHAVT
jgi:hypothetical protein